MNSHSWLRYFEANHQNFITPDWKAPVPLTNELLARSLSHFQLGESGGGGRHLFGKAAQQIDSDAAYRQALELFVAEETEHARLLAGLVQRFGGAIGRTFFFAARVAPSG